MMSRMRLVKLFVLIICWRLNKAAPVPGCENCGCCVDEVCADVKVKGNLVEDYCTKGCNPGIGGYKCYNKCRDDCVTCEQATHNNCTTCENGKYLSTVTRATNSGKHKYQGCVDCPVTCTHCTSNITCQTCSNGYFNTNEKCMSPCPDTCKTCSSLNSCQSCKDGYFNGKVIASSNEVTNCSLRCRDTCLLCTLYDNCTSCKPGHYGSYCQHNCSFGCNKSECASSDGSCECKDGFDGSLCNECTAGVYGQTCDVPCLSRKCPNNICNRDTGNCISCPDGFYGLRCNISCSLGCSSNVCDYESGACIECRKPYSGDKCCLAGGHCRYCASNKVCETCDNRYYGEECDEPCPTSCYTDGQNLQCHKDNGKCLTCLNGYHGEFCNMTCSEGCANNRCNKDGGHCTDGCTDDYMGPTCAQVDDNASIVGIAVGISTSTIVVVIVIVISAVCFIFRRWKQNIQPGKVVEASYENSEFQPETAICNLEENALTPKEYELGARFQTDDKVYDELK